MFLGNAILLLTLVALTFAEPLPQAATTESGSAPTGLGSFLTESGSFPSAAPSLSDVLNSLSALESLEAGMPTLNPSVESVLLTAIPSGVYTDLECQTTTPGWYLSLPADVKSALSSYELAFASWYSVHSAAIDLTTSLPGNVCAGTVFISGMGASTAFASASTAHATATGAATATATSAGGQATGTAASGSASSGAVGSSSSKAAAPHATAAIDISFVGVVGVLGLMAAL
jgi:hypothetical protein